VWGGGVERCGYGTTSLRASVHQHRSMVATHAHPETPTPTPPPSGNRTLTPCARTFSSTACAAACTWQHQTRTARGRRTPPPPRRRARPDAIGRRSRGGAGRRAGRGRRRGRGGPCARRWRGAGAGGGLLPLRVVVLPLLLLLLLLRVVVVVLLLLLRLAVFVVGVRAVPRGSAAAAAAAAASPFAAVSARCWTVRLPARAGLHALERRPAQTAGGTRRFRRGTRERGGDWSVRLERPRSRRLLRRPQLTRQQQPVAAFFASAVPAPTYRLWLCGGAGAAALSSRSGGQILVKSGVVYVVLHVVCSLYVWLHNGSTTKTTAAAQASEITCFSSAAQPRAAPR